MSHSRKSRRQFITDATIAVGASMLLPNILQASPAQKTFTVQEVIDIIFKAIPGAPFGKTVDTLKSASGSIMVTGVVTTMFATVEVIRKTIDAKANFIIAHEPTFYNHLDETEWLESSDVFKFKKELLEKSKIAVWRFHDHWHTQNLDGIRQGVLQTLGWENFLDTANNRIVNLQGETLSSIISNAKSKLAIKELRYIGDAEQVCKKVLLIPGAAGGRTQISEIIKSQPDLLICGEVAEWETAEYVRDSRSIGKNISLIVLGHSQSEEPGMNYLVNWLKPKIAPLAVTHIPSNNPFNFR
jgi:putative NIF3 family GTP cyclohydrolase 1 type 2